MKYLFVLSFIIVIAALPGTYRGLLVRSGLYPNNLSESKESSKHDRRRLTVCGTLTIKILVFSKTTGFRHDSIPDGIAAIRQLGEQNGFDVDATEDSSNFNDGNLSRYQTIVFLNTTGDVLDGNQQSAFERYVRGGGGFVGVHSATDTEYDWAWYGGLVGAYFQSHPNIQRATIRVEDGVHPSTEGLPAVWERNDEWYNFRFNPRGRVRVLTALDETTYSGGAMGVDHPICWCQLYDGGRGWYTAGGHTRESYGEPLFRQHLLGGIQFAARIKDGACSAIACASAASFKPDVLAGESIAALFGVELSATTMAATSVPLPTSLAGLSVKVKDSAGVERLAPLFFVSPAQINFLVPPNATSGAGLVTVVKADGTAPSGAAQLDRIAPSLFAANANGRGAAAGVLLVRTDNFTERYLPLAVFDPATGGFVPNPIDMTDLLNNYFLILFGTGIRGGSSVSAQIGGVAAPVLYAGQQGDFAGLDQINIRLPRELVGRGQMDVELKVDGQAANVVRVSVK